MVFFFDECDLFVTRVTINCLDITTFSSNFIAAIVSSPGLVKRQTGTHAELIRRLAFEPGEDIFPFYSTVAAEDQDYIVKFLIRDSNTNFADFGSRYQDRVDLIYDIS